VPVALVTGGPIATIYVKRLQDLGYEVVNGSSVILSRLAVAGDTDRELTEEELGAALVNASIYIYGGLEPATRSALSQAKALRHIVFLGTGWSDPGCVDPHAARDLGLRVSNTPHANAWSTAEMTVGLLLALERQIIPMDRDLRQGLETQLRRRDLSGLRVGVLGLGHVGSAVARILVGGFGAVVNYSSRTAKPDLEAELGLQRMSMGDLFSGSDYVSVHTPGSETLGLVSSALIELMPKNAGIINTATPAIVDGDALATALEKGDLFGLAMDGVYKDPVLAARFAALGDRVIATPRAAWLTEDSYRRMASMAFESIEDAVSRRFPVRYEVLSPSA